MLGLTVSATGEQKKETLGGFGNNRLEPLVNSLGFLTANWSTILKEIK